MRSGQLIFSSGAHWRGLGQRCEWGSLFEAVGVREIFRVGGESGKRGASDRTAAPGGPSSKDGQKLAISPCHLSEPGLLWAGHVLGLSVSGMIHSFTYSAALEGQFWAKHMVGAGGAALIFSAVSWSTARGPTWRPVPVWWQWRCLPGVPELSPSSHSCAWSTSP